MTAERPAIGRPGHGRVEPVAAVARAAEEFGVSLALLGGYADALAAAASTGRMLDRDGIQRLRALGEAAARDAIPLRTLVSLSLRIAELTWPSLPDVGDAATASQVRSSGQAVLAVIAKAMDVISEGHARAQRDLLHQEEKARREFVGDLIEGRIDVHETAELAERFGIPLAGRHTVLVARAADGAFSDTSAATVRTALAARFGSHNTLVTVEDGQLVCIAPSSLGAVSGEFIRHLRATARDRLRWRAACGRSHGGPRGIALSFKEASQAIEIADRLGLDKQVLNAAELLVFPVLLRDRTAITDLVTEVLGPVCTARGGPGLLLDTLGVFFACSGNSAAAARRLGISVRAVTYRLERVRRLTGYAVTDPIQRFTLETAVLGARLLGWPRRVSGPDPHQVP